MPERSSIRGQAADGAAAVKAVREERERGRGFDAVFMDVQMPVMDGDVACGLIRASEAEGKRVPIFALTGWAEQADHDRCVASGMDEFAAKPLVLATAERLLRTHVKRRS